MAIVNDLNINTCQIVGNIGGSETKKIKIPNVLAISPSNLTTYYDGTTKTLYVPEGINFVDFTLGSDIQLEKICPQGNYDFYNTFEITIFCDMMNYTVTSSDYPILILGGQIIVNKTSGTGDYSIKSGYFSRFPSITKEELGSTETRLMYVDGNWYSSGW